MNGLLILADGTRFDGGAVFNTTMAGTGLPSIATVAGGRAMVESLQQGPEGIVDVRSLQEYHA